jgi:hypothetical protein
MATLRPRAGAIRRRQRSAALRAGTVLLWSDAGADTERSFARLWRHSTIFADISHWTIAAARQA